MTVVLFGCGYGMRMRTADDVIGARRYLIEGPVALLRPARAEPSSPAGLYDLAAAESDTYISKSAAN
ncbi:MAG: hypothetical protein JO152_09975 [Mycobacteriaceae bacterium]|nr:hypothetical protein [Mycobacteriaceae bacterium]